MHIHKRLPLIFTYCFLFIGLLSSCYKKDVQVGSDLAESHTRIITVDTVGVTLSSYVLDSFVTNGNKFALIGNYSDVYTGVTNASTYFQPGLPTLSEDATTLLPRHAQFDSLVLYMKPSGYYYGDTLQPFTMNVYELAAQPEFAFLTYLYNNSRTATKTGGPLVSWTGTIRPSRKDSITMRFPNAMGQDWFNKIQSKASQMANETNFLDFFRGLNIQPSASSAAVYGFNFADTSIRLRMHYHLSIPYKVDKTIDFIMPTSREAYQYNRIITNRAGTTLERTTPGQKDFPATSANPFSITQTGTGVYLKAKFPSLRDLLKINDVVRLMDAKLVLKPIKGSYTTSGVNKLPNPLWMQTTDASNLPINTVLDSTQAIQYRAPIIDELYGTNTTYTFNITSLISALLNNSGTAENGLFIIEDNPNTAKQINRGVIGSRQNTTYQSKLILNILTIE